MKNTRHNLKKQMLFTGCAALLLFLVGASAHAVVLESGIPGVGVGGAQGAPLPDLATYINYLYIFVLSFVGIAGFISLVIWGTVWVASAVVDKKARAMEGIKNTLIGIGIALTAFIMLYTINPDLVIINIPKIETMPSNVFTCSKHPSDACPALAGCFVNAAGKCDLKSTSTGACLTDKITWAPGGYNLLNNNLAGDQCYDKCNLEANTLAACNALPTTTAFIVGKMCGALWVQTTIWTGNCTLDTYNAKAF